MTPRGPSIPPWAGCCSTLFVILLCTVHTLAFVPRHQPAVLRQCCHMSASSGTGAYEIKTIFPSDLKIVRFLGEQKLTIEEEDFPSGLRRTRYSARQESGSREMKTVGTAVRLFEAFNRAIGRPVVLKEVLPVMKDLANREMEMYQYLYQWGSQSDVRLEDLPVVPLLGSLVTGPEVEEDEEFVYVWRSQFPELEPPRSGNTWLLFDAPRLLPLPSLSRALPNGDLPTSSPSPQAEGGGLFGMLFGGGQAAKADKSLRVCRDVLREGVRSLAMLHQAGVVHGSLGPSSIIITLGDSGAMGGFGGQASSPIRGVKFADMGFASSALKQADFTSLVRRDVKQLAVSYLGFLPGYLNPSAPVEGSPVLSLDGLSLRRSLDELRKGAPLREALCSLDGWGQATALLDEADGWAVIEDMLEGRPGIDDPYDVCSGLLERPFLA